MLLLQSERVQFPEPYLEAKLLITLGLEEHGISSLRRHTCTLAHAHTCTHIHTYTYIYTPTHAHKPCTYTHTLHIQHIFTYTYTILKIIKISVSRIYLIFYLRVN